MAGHFADTTIASNRASKKTAISNAPAAWTLIRPGHLLAKKMALSRAQWRPLAGRVRESLSGSGYRTNQLTSSRGFLGRVSRLPRAKLALSICLPSARCFFGAVPFDSAPAYSAFYYGCSHCLRLQAFTLQNSFISMPKHRHNTTAPLVLDPCLVMQAVYLLGERAIYGNIIRKPYACTLLVVLLDTRRDSLEVRVDYALQSALAAGMWPPSHSN